jgi:hypothetical protein
MRSTCSRSSRRAASPRRWVSQAEPSVPPTSHERHEQPCRRRVHCASPFAPVRAAVSVPGRRTPPTPRGRSDRRR